MTGTDGRGSINHCQLYLKDSGRINGSNGRSATPTSIAEIQWSYGAEVIIPTPVHMGGNTPVALRVEVRRKLERKPETRPPGYDAAQALMIDDRSESV